MPEPLTSIPQIAVARLILTLSFKNTILGITLIFYTV